MSPGEQREALRVDAFPLQWPDGWPRTKHRHDAPYKVQLGQARHELLASVRLLGAREVVISSNVPVRTDGLPYAGTPERIADPGVAVYWTTGKGEPKVMACDRWLRPRENVRAIGLAIDGLRAIQRAGATQILDRAYTAFAALPVAAGATVLRSWREVLGLAGVFTREQLEARFRELAKTAHPDLAGGSTAAMTELTAARTSAIAHLEVNRG